MKKTILSLYEGKNVKIKLTDNTELTGRLEYIPEFNAKFGYRKPGFFAIGNVNFRSSYVKRLEEIF